MSNYKLTPSVDVSSSTVGGQINFFDTGGIFAVQMKAPTLASDIDFTLPSSSGTTGQLLKRTGATTLEWEEPVSASMSLPIQIVLTIGNLPVTPVNAGGNPPPGVIVAYFMYNGSTLSGTPTNFTVVYSSNGGSACRVYISDLTNSNNLIADTGNFQVNTALNTRVVTTFTNIPASQAIFFVSASVAGAGTLNLFSISLS